MKYESKLYRTNLNEYDKQMANSNCQNPGHLNCIRLQPSGMDLFTVKWWTQGKFAQITLTTSYANTR